MMTDRQQVIEIETRLAFQEDTINTLNDIVVQQQLQIDKLERISQTLVDRIRNLSATMNEEREYGNEKPPHY
jgi:SlyX protein